VRTTIPSRYVIGLKGQIITPQSEPATADSHIVEVPGGSQLTLSSHHSFHPHATGGKALAQCVECVVAA
jgi:hypothetical protein